MPCNEKRDAKRWMIGVFFGLASLFGSLLVALLICQLTGNPCRGAGGRNIHPLGIATGILICLSTIGLLFKRWVAVVQMVVALILAEGVVVLLIVYFSGAWEINRFIGMWFLGVNIYIGLPCLIGVVVAWGGLKLKR